MQAINRQPRREPEGAPVDYERHRPEQTTLYRLVQQHAATFFEQAAATARALGKALMVLEAAPRLLQRSVSPELAAHVRATHLAGDIDIRLNATLGDAAVLVDRLDALSVDGRRERVELLAMGVGAAPETRLARVCGLACDNCIAVDRSLRASDPAILALGDCASFPAHDTARRLRLESVQNANDQARTACATLTGAPEPYRALPWFWSEQGPMHLQMARLMPVDGVRHHWASANPASFSLLHYADERLVCVESVNAPLDHMAARKLIDSRSSPDPLAACNPSRLLKQLVDAS